MIMENEEWMKAFKLAIEALGKEPTCKDKLIENQQEQIACLQKKLFGAFSEKRSPVVEGQLGLFDEAQIARGESEPDAEEEVRSISATS